MMLGSLFLLAALSSVAMATSNAYQDADLVEDSDDLLDRLQAAAKRDHECAVIGGKCFNTGQCCNGLLCAVLDEDIGDKPEVPGYCVKSKDLQMCNVGGPEPLTGAAEGCPSGQRCMALGRMGQRYCLQVPRENGGIPEFRSIKMTDRRRYHSQASKGTGKLGSPCVSDLDCAPRSEDGLNRMCCQLVNRGRQGSKRICDRVTQISTCTSA